MELTDLARNCSGAAVLIHGSEDPSERWQSGLMHEPGKLAHLNKVPTVRIRLVPPRKVGRAVYRATVLTLSARKGTVSSNLTPSSIGFYLGVAQR